jgi:MFS family permease
MFVLGLFVWITALPLSLLIRHKPEQYGYAPYGKEQVQASFCGTISPKSGAVASQTKVVSTKATFWLIATSSMCYMLAVSAVVTHIMPFLTSVGMRRSTSSLVASVAPIISISGRMGFGWLSDIVDKRKIAVLGFALMTMGLIFFVYLAYGWSWMLLPFITTFGIGWGGSIAVRAALLRERFGRTRFGTIYGFVIGIAMLGNIAGPPLAGWIFDTWGSYLWAWVVLALLCFVGLVLVLLLPSSREFENERILA